MKGHSFALYTRYVATHIRCKTEYAVSFAFVLVSMAVIPLLELLGITLLFDRFGSIRGWTFYEVLLTFAIINFGNAVSEIVFRGFDRFSKMIVNAGFDRLLLRPRSLTLQVLGSDFEIARVGRVVTALFFMGLALAHLPVNCDLQSVMLVALMMLSATAIFSGVYILRAALCFWTIEGLEVTNILSDGGRTAMQYPIAIYNRVFRFVFTFLVPFGAANYYPLLWLLHKTDYANPWYILSPLLGVLFPLPCYALWRLGVRRYASTGS